MPRLATTLYSIALMAAVMLVPAAARINAAPLDLSAVPADAKSLMHFDMNAARSSVVMRRGWEQMLKKNPQAGAMMDVVSQMVGMDPRKDLRDVTAYGIDTDKRNGVMIVRAKTNRDFLTRMVEKTADHKTMNHGDYTLHAWTHKRDDHSGPMVGAFHKDDVMVFSRTEAAVKSALDVLDGRQAAVTEKAGLAGRVRPGSIVVARATAVDPGTKCPVLKQAQGFRWALGEHEGKSFLRVRRVTRWRSFTTSRRCWAAAGGPVRRRRRRPADGPPCPSRDRHVPSRRAVRGVAVRHRAAHVHEPPAWRATACRATGGRVAGCRRSGLGSA